MLKVIIGIIAVFILVLFLIWHSRRDDSRRKLHGSEDRKKTEFWEWIFTPEYKRAGIRGEEAVVRAIESVLREGDNLFTNVSVEYDGKPAELDNVIVNKYGVFIIEVKNYTGHVVGSEDDYEWQKFKTTDAGNTYVKTVKNPIKQVKRQIYILARYLEYYGIQVWVKGYAIMLHGNSPVDSDYLLKSVEDIDRAIHTNDRTMLSTNTIERIAKLLSD